MRKISARQLRRLEAVVPKIEKAWQEADYSYNYAGPGEEATPGHVKLNTVAGGSPEAITAHALELEMCFYELRNLVRELNEALARKNSVGFYKLRSKFQSRY